MNVATQAVARRLAAGSGVAIRSLAIALLTALALVPSLARAHDRLHRTPTDIHSRFRWANSCESVPQKISPVAAATPVEIPVEPVVDAPARFWRRPPPAVAPRQAAPFPAWPRPLRAPPPPAA
jgi:hypothetical protein